MVGERDSALAGIRFSSAAIFVLLDEFQSLEMPALLPRMFIAVSRTIVGRGLSQRTPKVTLHAQLHDTVSFSLFFFHDRNENATAIRNIRARIDRLAFAALRDLPLGGHLIFGIGSWLLRILFWCSRGTRTSVQQNSLLVVFH